MPQTLTHQSEIAPPRPRNIFNIEAELDQIGDGFEQLEAGGAEDEVKIAVFGYFGDLIEERDRKLDGYAYRMAAIAGMVDVRKQEGNRLLALAKTDENIVKGMKRRLQEFFAYARITKTETKLHKFWVQVNGGARSIEILEPATEEWFWNKPFGRYVVRATTTSARWSNEKGCHVDDQPLTVSYAWDEPALLARLLDVEEDADAFAQAAALIKRGEIESNPRDLRAVEIELAVEAAAARTHEAHMLAAGFPFARLNPRGYHLRIK